MVEKAKSKIAVKIKGRYFGIFEDILMLVIVLVNLLFVAFDWSFGFAFFREFVQSISNDFYIYYRDVIHPDFLLYDAIFILIFVTEIIIQWVISVIRKIYSAWWIYPIANWYDVLGCIPLGAFRWLRLLRIVSMTLRLHKMGVINLRKTFFYKKFYSIYQTFVKDASDGALIVMIEAMQRGVKSASDGNIMADAIKPEQKELAKALATKIHELVEDNYNEHRDDMKEQIKLVVKDGFDQSPPMKKVEQIPLIGSRIIKRLEAQLSDISFQLVDSLSSKLASDEVAQIIENVINTSLDSMLQDEKGIKNKISSDDELSEILTNIVDRILQQLKEEIEKDRRSRSTFASPEDDKMDENYIL